MSEYKVELVQSRINKINIDIEMQDDTAVQIESQYKASVYEPNDEKDPTALIKVECDFKDSASKLLGVSCVAELFFTIDPIPENRVEILGQQTREIIQEELTKKVVDILEKMGHKIAIS